MSHVSYKEKTLNPPNTRRDSRKVLREYGFMFMSSIIIYKFIYEGTYASYRSCLSLVVTLSSFSAVRSYMICLLLARACHEVVSDFFTYEPTIDSYLVRHPHHIRVETLWEMS